MLVGSIYFFYIVQPSYREFLFAQLEQLYIPFPQALTKTVHTRPRGTQRERNLPVEDRLKK